ncbi:hypothetical protein [Sporomusa termitida]|uniref:Uncharacterized protein n=1 Tax=Sporomusa termitida TaxID=2377 RepID=A0A517DWS2_9FIRM|nr:hypothetical protein [Sporomusa termitida]QDR81792.1 hypothetical protein SPTER_32050 [Sporomusa termitida]
MPEEPIRPKIKLLLVTAKPADGHSEIHVLEQHLGDVCPHSVDVLKIRALSCDDVVKAVQTNLPDIVHFYGECTSDGRLHFIDDQGQVADWCGKSFFLKRISAAVAEIKLVYINGKITAKEIGVSNGKIAAIVGMQKKADDDLSRRFVIPFYVALAFGNPLGPAFAKLWQALPEQDRKLILCFRLDLNPDQFFLREQLKTAQN